jgi:hypothetical protein
METLFHGTNVILIALVNYYKKKDQGKAVPSRMKIQLA